MLILGCLILAAFLLPLFGAVIKPALASGKRSPLRALQRALGLHAGVLQINAFTDGVHGDGILGHLLADAAHSARHLTVKRGSDAAHFALGTAADEPLGICQDTPSAAEEPANVALFGRASGTMKAVGSEEIAVDAAVFCAANGKLQNTPSEAGTYWRVGKAVTACAGDGGQFGLSHHAPVRVVVLANSADLTAVKAAVTAPAELMFLGA